MRKLRKIALLTLGLFIFNMCVQSTGFIAFANNTSSNEKDLGEVSEVFEPNINKEVKMEIDELNELIESNVETNIQEVNQFSETKPQIKKEIEDTNMQPKSTISYSYDNPIVNHKLTGDFLVKGWAKSNELIANIEVCVDGVSQGQALLSSDSSDTTKSQFRFKVTGLANGNHTVAIIITDKANNKVEETRNIVVDNTKTIIMGQGSTTATQMIEMISRNNPLLSDKYINDFVTYVIKESKNEGVNHDILFSQIMVETGYLKFGGDVKVEQNNFAGIGATGNGNPGNSFSTVEIGVRAVVQHLKAYASKELLNLECVDPRFNYVKRGSAIYIEYLGIQENPDGYGWATGAGYGEKIKNIINNLKSINIVDNKSKALNVTVSGEYYTGKTLTFSAKASPHDDTLYKLLVCNRNTGKWEVLSDYSNINSIKYVPKESGVYSFVVHVKHKNSTTSDYDSFVSQDVTIKADVPNINSFEVLGDRVVNGILKLKVEAIPINNVEYKFWVLDKSAGNWNVIQDYSSKNEIEYIPKTNSNLAFVVHIRRKGVTANYETYKRVEVDVVNPISKVNDISVTGTLMNGSELTFKATATPQKDSLYKLWVADRKTGIWTVISDYSENNTIKYTPKSAGNYTFVAHVKHKNSKKEYDDFISKDVVVKESSAKVGNTNITGNKYVGSELTFNTSATTDDAMYRLWVADRKTGIWTMISDYSIKNTVKYTPKSAGNYTFVVHVKHKDSKKEYDDYASIDINIVAPKSEVTSLKITGTPMVGYSLTMSALAKPENDTLYKLWIADRTTGKWTVLSDYSNKNEINYTPEKSGRYTFVVHAKHKFSNSEYDDYKSVDINVILPQVKVKSFDVSGSNIINEEITMKATANLENDVLYKLWVCDRSTGEWIVVSDYSKTNTAKFIPKNIGRYSFIVHVKHKDSKKEYDDYYSKDLNIVAPNPIIKEFTVTGELKPGSNVTLISKASPEGNVLYKFWVCNRVTGEWKVISDYSEKNSIDYKIPSYGTFSFVVHVKRKGIQSNEPEVFKSNNIIVKQDKLIVIDAGHGGRDPGAVRTFNGVDYIEKDMNMQIAVKLEQNLKRLGYNVYMTRLPFSDLFIDLAPRVQVANYLDADLFVSIHHNAADSTVRGTEVYYSTDGVDENVRNYLINAGHGDPYNILNERILKSSTLSSEVSRKIANSIGIPNRGAKINEFHVNRNTKMPSILVEAGFITNSTEAILLAKPETQQKIADAILYGILDM